MYELTIPAMTCTHCQKTIIGIVLAIDGNATLNFDLAAHRVSVTSAAELKDLSEAIEASGYHIAAMQQAEQGHCHCDLCD